MSNEIEMVRYKDYEVTKGTQTLDNDVVVEYAEVDWGFREGGEEVSYRTMEDIIDLGGFVILENDKKITTREELRKVPMYKDKNGKRYTEEEAIAVIPKDTFYCYTPLGKELQDEVMVYKTKPCPFRDWFADKPDQEQGYCHFLERGDWDDSGNGILWDGCKECGINEDFDEDDYN